MFHFYGMFSMKIIHHLRILILNLMFMSKANCITHMINIDIYEEMQFLSGNDIIL